MLTSPCPLCSSCEHILFYSDKRRHQHSHQRSFLRCLVCHLVWVPKSMQLSTEQEKLEYDLHNNDVYDEGYRRFLARLARPLLERLCLGACGLDFGCGPGPALASMLKDAGMKLELYDYFYYPEPEVFNNHYDFICATEVIEHLSCPGEELDRLWACIKPGGVLALMSKLVINVDAFAAWHYKNDLTHISFFSKATLTWLAKYWGARLSYHADDVFFLEKPNI